MGRWRGSRRGSSTPHEKSKTPRRRERRSVAMDAIGGIGGMQATVVALEPPRPAQAVDVTNFAQSLNAAEAQPGIQSATVTDAPPVQVATPGDAIIDGMRNLGTDF